MNLIAASLFVILCVVLIVMLVYRWVIVEHRRAGDGTRRIRGRSAAVATSWPTRAWLRAVRLWRGFVSPIGRGFVSPIDWSALLSRGAMMRIDQPTQVGGGR